MPKPKPSSQPHPLANIIYERGAKPRSDSPDSHLYHGISDVAFGETSQKSNGAASIKRRIDIGTIPALLFIYFHLQPEKRS